MEQKYVKFHGYYHLYSHLCYFSFKYLVDSRIKMSTFIDFRSRKKSRFRAKKKKKKKKNGKKTGKLIVACRASLV